MDLQLVDAYWQQYGKRYFSKEIIKTYPETKIIPRYLMETFPRAEIVLDIGFGTGVWFWASFLPGLVRLDGIDISPEALAAADRIFDQDGVPEGFSLIHGKLGRKFKREDLQELAQKRGNFFFFDYTKPWPAQIIKNRYDLVTEHGGGFGEMKNEDEVAAAIKKCAKVLRKGGYLLFVNFKITGRQFCLNEKIISHAMQRAGLKMADFHVTTLQGKDRDTSSIEKVFYGYAQAA